MVDVYYDTTTLNKDGQPVGAANPGAELREYSLTVHRDNRVELVAKVRFMLVDETPETTIWKMLLDALPYNLSELRLVKLDP